MLKTGDINIRDPFIFTDKSAGCYYMYGSTVARWPRKQRHFDCYRSTDLKHWQGPFQVFKHHAAFWATHDFWAPEVHKYHGKYYMFATFKAKHKARACQILVATHPLGPFRALTDGPITPANWDCLDGTLHIDADNNPWLVFCHEWLQVHDGAMYAQQLTNNLKNVIGEPILLFNASEAPWSRKLSIKMQPFSPSLHKQHNYITDGPFVYQTTK